MRRSSLCFALLLALPALAGCLGGGGPAEAAFVATPLTPNKSSYKFDASGSSGDGLAYEWDFGDETPTATGKVVEHEYQYLNGMYTVTLAVNASDGTTSEAEQKIQVGEGQNSDPLLYLTADKRWVAPNESVIFDATQSFDPDGDPVRFEWNFNSHFADDELNDMENLGHQQYGRYVNGPPPGASNESGSGGNDTSNGTLLTPSGHDWREEFSKAQQRLQGRLGAGGFHGGAPGAAEPRNEELDGRIEDMSPIQIFEFPSPAVYYVHLRVLDVKGTGYDGFIKISVDDNVPERFQTNESGGRLDSAQLSTLTGTGGIEAYRGHPFKSDYPALVEATLNYSTENDLPGTAAMKGFMCGSQIQIAQCRGSAIKNDPWPSGEALTFNLTPAMVGAYQIMVENAGDPPVEYTLTINMTVDLNPWFLEESGLGGAHH